MDYAAHMEAIGAAARRMYAAQAAIPPRPAADECDAVWDEYLDARQDHSAARDAYDAAYAAKMGTAYPVRRA